VKVKVGTKVVVLSPDREKVLGDGVIEEFVTLVDEETGMAISNNVPVIRLKNGEKLYGFECWWVVKPCNDNPQQKCEGCVFAVVGCSEVKGEEVKSGE